MGTSARYLTETVAMLAGPTAWAAQFAVVYFVGSLACARGWEANDILGVPVPAAAILGATSVALLVIAARTAADLSGLRQKSLPDAVRFRRRVALALSALSLVAVAWTGLPATTLGYCG